MQTQESLRRLVDSAQDLRAIVRTMKALAAVSIRQYERAVSALADYDRTVRLGFQVLLRQAKLDLPPEDAKARPCMLAFGSDQGMCGQFNEHMVAFVSPLLVPVGHWRLVVAGSRLADRLAEAGHTADEVLPVPATPAGMTGAAQEVVLALDRARQAGHAGRVVLCHQRTKSGPGSAPRQVQLLPLTPGQLSSLRAERWPSRTLPMFTLDQDRLFAALVQEFIFVTVYQALAESLAAECAARLASMQAAEKNIDDRLEELTAAFNQQRQTAVTTELMDIVSGFEALRPAG